MFPGHDRHCHVVQLYVVILLLLLLLLSGHLLTDLRRPRGSLVDGKPALDKARHIKSLIKWWRWERPVFRLQNNACDPRVSTDAPQTQWYGWQISELNLRPTATLTTSSFRRSPHADIGTAWSQSPQWTAGAAMQESDSVILSRLIIDQWLKDVAYY